MKHTIKRVSSKLKSRKGETLVEILVAVLIVALAASLFASLYSATARIDRAAREQDKKLFDAVKVLEESIKSGGTTGKLEEKGQLQYVDKDGNVVAGKGVEVDVYAQNDMNAYRGNP